MGSDRRKRAVPPHRVSDGALEVAGNDSRVAGSMPRQLPPLPLPAACAWDECQDGGVATFSVIREFGQLAGSLPGIEPDIVETLVEFKSLHFADPDPAHWTVSVLEELVLGVLPRQMTAPDEWFGAVTPTVAAFLEFLATGGHLAPGSDSPDVLLGAVDRIGDRVLAASRDPRNVGIAKAILTAVGFDPLVPDSVDAAMGAFNALSDSERAAILDPALAGLGRDGSPPFAESGPFVGTVDRPSLPMIWLPPAAELVDAVRAAPLVQDLLRLTAWNGAQRKITSNDVLPLAEARRACAELDLPVPSGQLRSARRIPALHRLWRLALEGELLEIAGGVARQGEGADLLLDPDSDPEEVVSWWGYLLDACLVDALDLIVVPDRDDDLDEDVLEAVEDAVQPLLAELYSAGQLPLEALDKALREMVGEVLGSLWVAYDLSEVQISEHALRWWRSYVAGLVDVGAVIVEDGLLDLTPLGRVGVRAIARDEGVDAPLVDDPATLDAATLLRVLPPLGQSVGRPLLSAWSGHRRPAAAVEEILDAARAGTASTRVTASTVLRDAFSDHLRGPGRSRLESLREDSLLGTYARILLTEPDQPVQFPPRLRQWTALEAVAVTLESGAFDDANLVQETDVLAGLWQLVEEDADLNSVWSSNHPQLNDVLEAIATHHPKGPTRKAARKALFKARQRNP